MGVGPTMLFKRRSLTVLASHRVPGILQSLLPLFWDDRQGSPHFYVGAEAGTQVLLLVRLYRLSASGLSSSFFFFFLETIKDNSWPTECSGFR